MPALHFFKASEARSGSRSNTAKAKNDGARVCQVKRVPVMKDNMIVGIVSRRARRFRSNWAIKMSKRKCWKRDGKLTIIMTSGEAEEVDRNVR